MLKRLLYKVSMAQCAIMAVRFAQEKSGHLRYGFGSKPAVISAAIEPQQMP